MRNESKFIKIYTTVMLIILLLVLSSCGMSTIGPYSNTVPIPVYPDMDYSYPTSGGIIGAGQVFVNGAYQLCD